MKLVSRLLIAVALLTTGSFALAAPSHGNHDRRGQSHNRHDNRRHDNRRYDNRRHDNRRSSYNHGYRPASPRYPVRARWQRGHRYHGPTYVVRNYGHYHLRQPPRGYHWVRANNNDYLLVAIATGIILDMALQ